MTALLPPFCRNCGTPDASPGLEVCQACGASLATEPPTASLVGTTVTFGKIVGQGTGIVLNEDLDGQGPLIVADGAKVRTVRRGALTYSSATADSHSPAYRLHLASTLNAFRDHFESGGDIALGSVVDRRNELLADSTEARRFAASAIVDGDYAIIAKLRALGDLERSWAGMWAAHNCYAISGEAQAAEAALRFFCRLPDRCYPDKLCVAVANWPSFSADPEAVEHLRRAAAAFPTLPLAQAITVLLSTREDPAAPIGAYSMVETLRERGVPGVAWADAEGSGDVISKAEAALCRHRVKTDPLSPVEN